MNITNVKNVFSIGSSIWLVLFTIDYIIELFQINNSGIVTTIMGLRIRTIMTPKDLNTYFSITWQAVIVYITFMMLWALLSFLFNSLKIDNA